MTAKTLLLTSAILSLMALGARAETELTVYTAFEAELLERYAAAFNKDHPDIKINWVRDSHLQGAASQTFVNLRLHDFFYQNKLHQRGGNTASVTDARAARPACHRTELRARHHWWDC
mgnify:CR=1 FL=1